MWTPSEIWIPSEPWPLRLGCQSDSIVEKGTVYDTDLCIKAEVITPPILHDEPTLAYIRSMLIGGFEDFRNQVYGTNRDKNVYQSKREPSKIVLEDTLRTEFDNTGIFIENVTATGKGVKFFNQSENESGVLFGNQSEGQGVKFYNQSESIVTGGINFIVYIPVAIADKTEAVRNTTNIYKIEGVDFDVLTY